MSRLPAPKPDHLQSVQPPVTEPGEEERSEDGVASINYIVLDLDPTSSSESSAVAPASKTRDSVPNSAGKVDGGQYSSDADNPFQVELLELEDM